MRRASSAKTATAPKNRLRSIFPSTPVSSPPKPPQPRQSRLALVSGACTQNPAAMASSTPVSKPVQKILESTKLASLSRFIRRPHIDPETPIQGKPRQPGSNAFKEYQDREGRRLQKALNAISHGRHIFVYHNVRTNQVVYSLTRYLEVRSLSISLSESPELLRCSVNGYAFATTNCQSDIRT